MHIICMEPMASQRYQKIGKGATTVEACKKMQKTEFWRITSSE